jgi:hypothetical protein
MHMRPRPAAGLQPTAAVLRADRIHGPFSSRGARSGRWRLQLPIGGLLIGMTDAQGQSFRFGSAAIEVMWWMPPIVVKAGSAFALGSPCTAPQSRTGANGLTECARQMARIEKPAGVGNLRKSFVGSQQ